MYYLQCIILYMFSISVGLYITTLLLPNKQYDMREEIELEKEMIEHCKKIMFEQIPK